MFLHRRAAPLVLSGVAGCASVSSVVGDDFCAPSATHSGLVAKRHMAQADAQADAQAQELLALTLQNHVEDPAGTLTSLPADLLRKLLGFLTVDDVHERAKPVSKLVRSEARFVLTRGRWKPVKFVAEHGE